MEQLITATEKYTTITEEDGDYYITFPPELIEQLDWNVGDTLIWTLHEDETITVTKQ